MILHFGMAFSEQPLSHWDCVLVSDWHREMYNCGEQPRGGDRGHSAALSQHRPPALPWGEMVLGNPCHFTAFISVFKERNVPRLKFSKWKEKEVKHF